LRVKVAAVACLAAIACVPAPDGSATTRLKLQVTPQAVAAGGSVTVRITGTRVRRCTLTVRKDRFRAAPYLKRRVGRRSALTFSPRSTPGPRIVAVRCGRARAYAPLRIDAADTLADEAPPDELPPDDEPPLSDEPLTDEPPPDEVIPDEEEPIEVGPIGPLPGTPPDSTKPSTPTSVKRSAATTNSITLTWAASADNIGVTGYAAFRSGTRVANVAATSYRFTGLTCGKTYALGVAAYDAAGNQSGTASLNAATAACPDTRKVSVAKGASAQGRPGCTVAACRYVKVTFSGFSSGSHTVVCRASGGDEGGFYSYAQTGASSTSAVCYYGFSGRQVWATVDGKASSKITW
jgi:hypothetical protein